MEEKEATNDKPLEPTQSKPAHDSQEEVKSIQSPSGCHIKWNIKPLPTRDVNIILFRQNYLCATCGIKLTSNFLSKKKYHFCEYTGLMHCIKCHKKKKAIIPFQVLNNLNCKPFMVCNAAKKYLNKICSVPCITMDMFGKTKKVELDKKIIKLKRILFELQHIKQYLHNCNECSLYNEYKNDWIFYDGSLTLNDCVSILSSNTLDTFQILSKRLQKHIINKCDTCKSKGNHCQICKNENEIIYSFQYNKTVQCNECETCFHKKCWNSEAVQCTICKK